MKSIVENSMGKRDDDKLDGGHLDSYSFPDSFSLCEKSTTRGGPVVLPRPTRR